MTPWDQPVIKQLVEPDLPRSCFRILGTWTLAMGGAFKPPRAHIGAS